MSYLKLEDVPLFASLSGDGRQFLNEHAELRTVRRGEIVMRRGAMPKEFYVVAKGRVRVQPIASSARILGASEVLGEMSLISGSAVSATIVAETDVQLWILAGPLFLTLIQREPSLPLELLSRMAGRLRTSESARSLPSTRQVIVVEMTPSGQIADSFLSALHSVLQNYLPEIQCEQFTTASTALQALESWRESLFGSAFVVGVPRLAIAGIQGHLKEQDVMLRYAGNDNLKNLKGSSVADTAGYRLDSDPRPSADDTWAFLLVEKELQSAAQGQVCNRKTTPKLDRLARWLARKEIGLALSAGAALGFAHMGVLAELEVLGLPIDRISGTSIGGIAGLLYALGGNGERGIELAYETLGRKGATRMRLLPRSSILSDRVLRRRAAAVAKGRNFADLPIPVSVVATDLLRGRPVIIDQGSVADGFFATSAVPGVLPPVIDGEDVLVDGGLVARNPLDQLPSSRCGLRIAVNVIPPPFDDDLAVQQAIALRHRIQKPFGFREVMARSWNHLGWLHGLRDVADADILIEPCTRGSSGANFASAWGPMVEAGRIAVQVQAKELLSAAAEVLPQNPQPASNP